VQPTIGNLMGNRRQPEFHADSKENVSESIYPSCVPLLCIAHINSREMTGLREKSFLHRQSIGESQKLKYNIFYAFAAYCLIMLVKYSGTPFQRVLAVSNKQLTKFGLVLLWRF